MGVGGQSKQVLPAQEVGEGSIEGDQNVPVPHPPVPVFLETQVEAEICGQAYASQRLLTQTGTSTELATSVQEIA
jgi:hypothetical protein